MNSLEVRRLLTVGAGVLLAAVVSSLPRPALAGSSEADKVATRVLMREGRLLRDAGDHAGALSKFRAAYDLFPTPVTGVAVAREQVAIGHLVEAHLLLGEIARLPVTSTETDAGTRARAEASAMDAEILPRIPVVEVLVVGAPPGDVVAITIDGRAVSLSEASAGAPINPGTHLLVLRVGATEQSKTFHVDERGHVRLRFDAPAAVAANEPRTPPATKAAPPTPRASGASPTSIAAPVVERRSSAPTTTWVGVSAIGAGVVALGVSGVLGISARSLYDETRTAHCPTGACDPDGIAGIARARDRSGKATVFLGVGVALTLGGGLLWAFTPPKGGSKAAVTSIGVGVGGITVGGRF